jgi:PAS domain S-box-containing protein
LANEGFVALSGFSLQEIEGKKRWTEFVVKEDLERMKEQHTLRRKDTAAALRNYEFRFVDRHSNIKDILLTVGMIPGTTKSVTSLLDITERKRAEEQIAAALQEKEVLLKEIHHRVKNNLQVICSLLDLQSDYIEDERTLQMLKDSRARVRSMALIHEKLYQAQDLTRVDFGEYIQNLAKSLFRSYRTQTAGVTLKVNVADVLLDIDRAIPCGLIINEMVSNALKYGFPDGREGEICVELFSASGEFTLVVRDNGVGFPQDLDFRKTKTLGLKLVTTLAKQLRGTIELYSNGGTEFKLRFAAPERKGRA